MIPAAELQQRLLQMRRAKAEALRTARLYGRRRDLELRLEGFNDAERVLQRVIAEHTRT